jgi:hypothetical protein
MSDAVKETVAKVTGVVQTNPGITLVILLVLVILIIWYAVTCAVAAKSTFLNPGPTALLKYQQQDAVGVGGGLGGADSDFARIARGEGMAGGPVTVQAAPGSAAWQVLHSDDYDCANRVKSTDNAWAWMSKRAPDAVRGAEGMTDADLSAQMSGMRMQ